MRLRLMCVSCTLQGRAVWVPAVPVRLQGQLRGLYFLSDIHSMSFYFSSSFQHYFCMFDCHVPPRDEHYGFQLYQSDPSGNYGGWKAVAIGAGAQAAQNLLKTEFKEETTVCALCVPSRC
jgi:hypothetical protein